MACAVKEIASDEHASRTSRGMLSVASSVLGSDRVLPAACCSKKSEERVSGRRLSGDKLLLCVRGVVSVGDAALGMITVCSAVSFGGCAAGKGEEVGVAAAVQSKASSSCPASSRGEDK